MDSTVKALRGLNICAPVSAEDDERGCAGCPYDPEVCTHRRAVSLPDMMIEDIRAALGEALRRRSAEQDAAAVIERIADFLAGYAYPPETDFEVAAGMNHVRRRGQWVKFLRGL